MASFFHGHPFGLNCGLNQTVCVHAGTDNLQLNALLICFPISWNPKPTPNKDLWMRNVRSEEAAERHWPLWVPALWDTDTKGRWRREIESNYDWMENPSVKAKKRR